MKKLMIIILLLACICLPSFGDEFDMFMNHGSVMMIINSEGTIVFANYAAARFYKTELETLLTTNIKDINVLSKEDVEREMALAIDQSRNYFNFRHRLFDNSLKDVEVYSYPIEYEGESMLFSIVIDVTDRNIFQQELAIAMRNKQRVANSILLTLLFSGIILSIFLLNTARVNKKLRRLSNYDHLTTVYNRYKGREIFQKMIKKSMFPLAFYMIDVNNLKFINDTFGHIKGDEMIVKTTVELSHYIHDNGFVSRVSGDEFIAVLNVNSEQEAVDIEDEIKKIIIRINGVDFDVSVGHHFINETITYDLAFSTAEAYMYKHKNDHKMISKKRIIRELLFKVKQRLPDYDAHQKLLNEWLEEVCKILDIPDDDKKTLSDAVKYQDIGIAAVDEEEDFALVHSEKSYGILNTLGVPYPVSNAVLYHHELYDGTGYPKGIKANDIPYSARILCIINFLYKESMTKEPVQVVKELRNYKGIRYDPDISEKLLNSNLQSIIEKIHFEEEN